MGIIRRQDICNVRANCLKSHGDPQGFIYFQLVPPPYKYILIEQDSINESLRSARQHNLRICIQSKRQTLKASLQFKLILLITL